MHPISKSYKEKIIIVDSTVSRITHTSIADMHDKNRRQDLVYAKFLAWYLLRKFDLPYTVIAAAYEKDHTSIIHGVERVRADSEWKARADLIFSENFANVPNY